MHSNEPSIAFGQVRHRRLRPIARAFSYRAFYLRLPIRVNGEKREQADSWWFSTKRRAMLGVHPRDHGNRQDSDNLPWLLDLLDRANVRCDGDIFLHAFPSILGYSFKPVSFWFCHSANAKLAAIVCEVHNTFGEQHCYVLSPDQPIKQGQSLSSSKQFHVSPFFPIEGAYRFRFMNCMHNPSNVRSVAKIDYYDDQGDLLITSMSGTHVPLSKESAIKAFLAYPLFSLGVVARIHWQALLLVARRVKFYSKPALPKQRFTKSAS